MALFFDFTFQIDLLTPLADQGPFAVIIHKLTDVLTQAHQGDKMAQTMIANVQVSVVMSTVINTAERKCASLPHDI